MVSRCFSGLPIACISAFVIPTLVSANFAASQTRRSATPPTFTLHTVASNRIAVPPFSAEGPTQCDGAGNVYFAVTSSNLNTKTILRISNDGEDAKPFVLPNDLGAGGNWSFYVSPFGTIYALFTRNDGSAHTLVEDSDSGEELRRTVWQVPKDLYVYSFVVLPGGRAMVRGQLPLPDKPSGGDEKVIDRSGPYTAWLGADGRPIREINGAADGNKLIASTDWRASAISPGPEETFVSIFGASLNVYSSAGLLLHSSPVTKPADDATPYTMQLADGLMAVGFAQTKQVEIQRPTGFGSSEDRPTAKVSVRRTTWLLISPEDGLSHGFYKMPDDFRGSSLCYLGNANFLYLTGKDGHSMLVRARPN